MRFKAAVALTLLTFSLAANAQQIPADTVLLNGRIFTCDSVHPRAEALAIRGDRIVAVGSTSEIHALIGPHTRRIDVGDRVVIPGFNDAHIHLEVEPANVVSLESKSFDPAWSEMSAAIQTAVLKAPKGSIISGDIAMSIFNDPEANRNSLDKLSPNDPVILTTVSGHASILNSAALKRFGIEGRPDPMGGRYERSPDGRLTGTIREYADMQLARTLADQTSEADALAQLRKKLAQATKWGITSMQDMSNAMPPERAVALLEKVPTPVRVRVMRMPMTTSKGRDTEEGKSLLKTRPSALITVSGTKWLLDGTPLELTFAPRGSRPFGKPPFDDRFSDLGPLFSQTELKAMLQESLQSDDQLLLHVSGYPAAAAMLSAMESAGGKRVWAGRRVRFEHGDGLYPDLVTRVKQLGIVVVQNPSHFSVGQPLGPELFGEAQPLKSLLAAGIPVALGSDGPMNPFLNIMLACIHPNRLSQAITVEQAVTAYALTSAYAEFMEQDKGSLEPGKLADLAVLSQDIFEIPLQDLPKTESVLTMVGGKVVYDAKVVTTQ